MNLSKEKLKIKTNIKKEIIDKNINKFDTIAEFLSDVSNVISNLKHVNLCLEISEIRQFNYIYMISFKDTTGIIRGKLYSNRYNNDLNIGDKVDITGSICLFYGKNYKNEVEINIEEYKIMGDGILHLSFDKLKKEAEELGLFVGKQQIHNNYKKIGIISSLSAAGLKDVINIFNKNVCGVEFAIYPSIMQGDKSPISVINAINRAHKHKYVDIILITRGGGAKEDLECFNNLELAKTIHNSNIPIVTAIGHEIDITIADLVSDKYFITPSEMASNLLINRKEIKNKIKTIEDKLINYYTKIYNNCKLDIQEINNELVKYNTSDIYESINSTNKLIYNLGNYFIDKYNKKKDEFNKYNNKLKAVNLAVNININLSNFNDLYSKFDNYYKEYINSRFNLLNQCQSQLNTHKNKLLESNDKICIYDINGAQITSLREFNKNATSTIKISFYDGDINIKYKIN